MKELKAVGDMIYYNEEHHYGFRIGISALEDNKPVPILVITMPDHQKRRCTTFVPLTIEQAMALGKNLLAAADAAPNAALEDIPAPLPLSPEDVAYGRAVIERMKGGC